MDMSSHHGFHNHTAHTHTVFSSAVPTILIPVAALLAIAFGSWLWYRVSAIKVGNGSHGLRTENGREYLLEEEQRGEDEVLSRQCGIVCGLHATCYQQLSSFLLRRSSRRLLICKMPSARVLHLSWSQSTSTWVSSWSVYCGMTAVKGELRYRSQLGVFCSDYHVHRHLRPAQLPRWLHEEMD